MSEHTARERRPALNMPKGTPKGGGRISDREIRDVLRSSQAINGQQTYNPRLACLLQTAPPTDQQNDVVSIIVVTDGGAGRTIKVKLDELKSANDLYCLASDLGAGSRHAIQAAFYTLSGWKRDLKNIKNPYEDKVDRETTPLFTEAEVKASTRPRSTRSSRRGATRATRPTSPPGTCSS